MSLSVIKFVSRKEVVEFTLVTHSAVNSETLSLLKITNASLPVKKCWTVESIHAENAVMLEIARNALLYILSLNTAHVGRHRLNLQLFVEQLLLNVKTLVIRKWIVDIPASNYAITENVVAMKRYSLNVSVEKNKYKRLVEEKLCV